MKHVLFILSTLVVLMLIATGAFVSESQNLIRTVNGMAELSDFEIAQKVGVPWRTWRDEYREQDGKKAKCKDDIYLSCPRNESTWYVSLANCERCKPANSDNNAYFNMIIVGQIDSYCKRSYGNCTYSEKKTNTTSCDCYLYHRCTY